MSRCEARWVVFLAWDLISWGEQQKFLMVEEKNAAMRPIELCVLMTNHDQEELIPFGSSLTF